MTVESLRMVDRASFINTLSVTQLASTATHEKTTNEGKVPDAARVI